MPHFSRSKIKMRRDVHHQDMHGHPVEYRGIGFLQFRTAWNDTTRSFSPMTEEQKQICDDLWRQLAEAGVEIGVTISERIPGTDDVRQFPKVMAFQLMVNNPDGSLTSNSPKPSAPIPSPDGESNGW